jgi:copper chaperone
MSCGGCVKKLTGRLQDAAGVDSVEVTLEPGTAVVRGLISNADARRVIEDAGFRAVG